MTSYFAAVETWSCFLSSGDDVRYVPKDIGKTEVATGVAVGEFFVIQPNRCSGGMPIVGVAGVLNCGVAVFIR